MGDEIGIERTQTEEEKKDFARIGDETPMTKFLVELAKVEQKFAKQHLPFDAACAKVDFADEIERVEKESSRTYGYVRKEDVAKMKFGSLETYGGEKGLELVDEQEVFEMQNINGTRTNMKTGMRKDFVCKRGHGISVFVPNEAVKGVK